MLRSTTQGTIVVDWPKIIEQYGPYVWSTAYRLLSDREEANDCYQETFLQVVEYSQTHEIESWPALLKRVATRRALDRLRQRYRSRTVLVDSVDTDVPLEAAPDRELQLREWMEQLRQAVTELPPQQAEVFWLSEVEKLEHAEIAAQLTTSPQQVATWLHRAKQKLRRVLVERGIVDEVMQ